VGNLKNLNPVMRPPDNATGTYKSVGSTESVYLTCLESANKRDLLRSLSLPNRTSLSNSTNATVSGEYSLVTKGIKHTLFFLTEHAGQRRDGINAVFP